jgi:hypothetical protein
MRVLLSTRGPRVDVEPMMGPAAQRATRGAPVRRRATRRPKNVMRRSRPA